MNKHDTSDASEKSESIVYSTMGCCPPPHSLEYIQFVVINGIRYTVEIDHRDDYSNHDGSLGSINFDQMHIKIKTAFQCEEMAKISLLHECVHAMTKLNVLEGSSEELNERIATQMSQSLYTFIRYNPELIEILSRKQR